MEEKNIECKEIEKFKTNVWLTRKARINASERLIKASKFVRFLNVYYSCFLIILSLIDMGSDKMDLNILSLCLSITLSLSLFFIDSQQFMERANLLKNNYIEMQRILFHLSNKNFEDMKDLYLELLGECENHTNHDFYKVKFEADGSFGEKLINFFKYLFFYRLWIFLVRSLLIFVPLIVSIIWVF